MNKILIILAGIAFAASSMAQTRGAVQTSYYQLAEVEHAAYSTLRLMDSGNYRELWKKTANKARGGMTESAWIETVTSVRKTFGSYRDRKAERSGFSDQIDGGEKGLFYGVIFQTQFSSMAAEEKVIMAFEAGEWKLAGYFLKTSAAK
jgi:hypothetical protein